MITPTEIRQKVERHYLPFLETWVRGEQFVPLVFPVGKLPGEYAQLRTEVQRLLGQAKTATGRGYTVESQVKAKRTLGSQTLPVRIIIETPEDLLAILQKETEFADFKQDVLLIRTQLPMLLDWVARYPQKVLAQHGEWSSLLAVCSYFQQHPCPHLYIRELPIAVHTKFIEQHTGILRELLENILPAEAIDTTAPTFQQRFGLREDEPLISARFLADQLRVQYGIPLDELALPVSQLARLSLHGQTCIITENKMTFLTLPALPETFALLGAGFKVGLLAAVPWLHACRILYWGDLDSHGFQILSQLRAIFPHVCSVMMDENTFQSFSEFAVSGTLTSVRRLPHLTPEEHSLFLMLTINNQRLEQERISHTYALMHIKAALAP